MKRIRLLRQYLFSTRDVISEIETMDQLREVSLSVWGHVPDASSGTKRKIRRALLAKEQELKGKVMV